MTWVWIVLVVWLVSMGINVLLIRRASKDTSLDKHGAAYVVLTGPIFVVVLTAAIGYMLLVEAFAWLCGLKGGGDE